jgi:hypothetical protein
VTPNFFSSWSVWSAITIPIASEAMAVSGSDLTPISYIC